MTAPATLDDFSRSSGFSSEASSTAQTTPANNTQLTDAQRPELPHPAYERMRPRWEKCRILMAGTDAVRDAGEKYLPRLEGESDDAYTFRSQLVALFNGYKRTVQACVGMITQKQPTLGDDMPAALVAIWENIDRQGTHGSVFTKELATNGMVDGIAGIFVDYPEVPDGPQLSGDEEQRANLRPYFVRYDADDVIKPIYEVVNGVRTLMLLILRETSDQRVPPFGLETVTRYRVYSLDGATVSYELWERRAFESISRRVQDPRPMKNITAIPWSPFVAGDKVDQNETRPPLMDLADLNIEHYQVKTNIRNLESLAMVPSIVRIGAPADAEGNYPPITLGPRNTIEVPESAVATTPVYWLTPPVAVLDPGSRSLADIKSDMGAAGLAFLAPDLRRAETADAKRIDATAQHATLRSVAGALQDCLETAFMFAGQYIKKPGGSVTVNTDFEKIAMDATMVTALTGASANGKLSIETFLALLEGGQVLPEGFDVQSELKRILTENANTLNSMNPPPDSGGAPTAA